MKKLSIFLLALVACAGTMLASDTSVDGIWYNFNNGNLTAEVTYRGAESYSYSNEYSGEVVIPSSVTYNAQTYSVTSIGNEAFRECTGLTSVMIPNSVTSIGYQAFRECSGLTSVMIPNSVTSIGYQAFQSCSGLTSVTIPNSVKSIGEGAFWNCSSLTSVTIPNTVTSIGRGAFSDCSGLTAIDVAADNPNYSSEDGVLFNRDKTTLVAYPKGKQGGDYTIPNSVTSIGDFAFWYCTGLTSVTIPNTVTSIGEGAFQSCSGLTSVTIPNSVTSIGDYAFYGCTGLTSVEIPNSVTSIGGSAFSYCAGLTSLSVEAGNTVYDSRNNCNAIIETSTNTLISGCPNTTIPNSVTSIGEGAFEGCTGLTSVTIPNSVTSIGDYAFYKCSGLTSITNYATTPQTIDSFVFDNVNKSTCVLNVPKVSVSLYQAANVWKEFTHIVGVDVPDVPSSTPAVYTNPANPAQKLIRNGNVYILTEDKTYSIDGRQVR